MRVHEDLVYIEQTQSEIERLSKELGALQKEAESLYVFGQDLAAAESDLKVENIVIGNILSKLKRLLLTSFMVFGK